LFAKISAQFNSLQTNRFVEASNQLDVLKLTSASVTNRFNSLKTNRFVEACNQFEVWISKYVKASNQIPIAPTYRVVASVMLDVIPFKILRYFSSSISFDIESRKNFRQANVFNIYGLQHQEQMLAKCSNILDVNRHDARVSASNLFAANNRLYFKSPTLRHIFTREGWRLILTRTETGEEIDLGFVNADDADRAIRDVDLPAGGYELSVRSSSLFWENIFDRVKRTFVIQPDAPQPVLGTPPIYHLRSSVSRGVTTIRWSCDLGEFLDCDFWIWLSEDFFVDTAAEPTYKIPRQTGQTEYAIEITQNRTLRCAVQVVAGGGALRGDILETVLSWKNTPAQRPEDQIAERTVTGTRFQIPELFFNT
jgi:hypothetical protein